MLNRHANGHDFFINNLYASRSWKVNVREMQSDCFETKKKLMTTRKYFQVPLLFKFHHRPHGTKLRLMLLSFRFRRIIEIMVIHLKINNGSFSAKQQGMNCNIFRGKIGKINNKFELIFYTILCLALDANNSKSVWKNVVLYTAAKWAVRLQKKSI